jgi:hypothetical protein
MEVGKLAARLEWGGFLMPLSRRRIAAMANQISELLNQLRDLERLHDQLQKARSSCQRRRRRACQSRTSLPQSQRRHREPV